MCGFSGFISKNVISDICQNMMNQLIHRGPDDSEIWMDKEMSVVLGHSAYLFRIYRLWDISRYDLHPHDLHECSIHEVYLLTHIHMK